MYTVSDTDIFYFSGTGNAKKIAEWFSVFALERNIQCRIFDISKSPKVDVKSSSLILIISPTHGFNYPKITMDFINNFPKGKNNIVLMNTRGGLRIGGIITPGLSGICFMLSSFLLRKKGFKIVGQIPFDMPSNWISIHPALSNKSVDYLFKGNYKRVEKHAKKIFSGEKDFLARRDLIQDILISPISIGYYIVGRFVFAKSFYPDYNCNNCGLCIKQCPVKAIKSINDRPFWTMHCESCMKCMNSCPHDAINTSHGFLVGIYFLASLFTSLLLENILHNLIDLNSLRLVLFTILFMIFLWLGYKFQHILLQNKLISKIISYVSLTHYKFWGRYKGL